MKGTLQKAFWYQGDNMNLPVADLERAGAIGHAVILVPETLSAGDEEYFKAVSSGPAR